jgi:hypothetical protein
MGKGGPQNASDLSLSPTVLLSTTPGNLAYFPQLRLGEFDETGLAMRLSLLAEKRGPLVSAIPLFQSLS